MDGRENGKEASVKMTYLRLDIQETPPARLLDLPNGHETRPVEIAGELSVLDESALRDELLELVLRDEVVVLSILFARTRSASSVFQGHPRHEA